MLSGQRILFYEPAGHHCAEIKSRIGLLAVDKQKIARKDEHLICLAVSSNGLVISSEISCRNVFLELGRLYPPVSSIYWVSPLTCEVLSNWLLSPGAVLPEWQLMDRR